MHQDRSLPLGDSPLTHTEPVPNNEVRFAEVICILDWEQEPMLCFPHKAHGADLIPCTGHVRINLAAPHLHIQILLFFSENSPYDRDAKDISHLVPKV